jgi:hypothetical protein
MSSFARCVDDIAGIAGTAPATTAEEFVRQLSIAADRLTEAGVRGAEDLHAAVTLVKPLALLLANVGEMADEYRDTV